jgi:effector-binding domain-containing protein
MKFFKRFLVFLLVLIALVLIVAIFLPSTQHVEDTAVINAPPEMIFKHVNNLQEWNAWSPFQKEDSAMTSEYEGPSEGVGAIQKWKSKVSGDGVMTIMESTPYSAIKFKVDFMDKGISYSEWKFEKQDKSTKATWSIDIGGLGYPMGRIFGLFMPGMMHKVFRGGLEDLKKLCETEFANMMEYKTGEIIVKENDAWKALAIKDSSTCDKVGDVMGAVFGELGKYCGENKIVCAGLPYAKYFKWDDKADKFVMEAGFPVIVKVSGNDRIYYVEYPKMKVATAVHYGSYESTYFSYQAIEKFIKDNRLKQNGAPWEVYINDPQKVKDVSKLQTQIYYPVK